jgi:uncharacterized iron-regulated protein
VLLLADHPLAGRIWDVQAQRFVERAAFERRLAAAEVALLGETHDNPVHHERQLELYRGLIERGRRPTLALEPLDAEHQPAIDAAAAWPETSSEALRRAAQVAPGWQWSFYEPLVAVALRERLPIVAANLSRPRAREVSRSGFAALGAGEAARLALEPVWSEALGKALRANLVASHCGHDSPGIDGMLLAQRARDAVMADRLAAAPAPVVAIVGRGHARRDLAVPLYLRHRHPGRDVVSVAFVEVREGAGEPSGYAEAGEAAHDFLWFTPRADRPDPCKGLAGRLM